MFNLNLKSIIKSLPIFLLIIIFHAGFSSCNKSNIDKEEIRKFAEGVESLIEDNNVKALKVLYPDLTATEIGFPDQHKKITIDDQDEDNIIRIHYGKLAWIDVQVRKNGPIIVDSEGIVKNNNISSEATKGQPAKQSSSNNSDSGYHKLAVSNVVESIEGHLASDGKNTYNAYNLFDGKASTAWALRLSDVEGMISYETRLYGPHFDVHGSKLAYVVIRNGYHKNASIYNKNTRANWIMIYRDGNGDNIPDSDIIYAGGLADTMSPQTLHVNPGFDQSRPIGHVGIAFKPLMENGFYHGSKWDDLSISELEFWGK